jgi:hypothetical protein
MAVNENNKYYTPGWLVKQVITTMLIILSGITITEFIEPSAGDGAFIEELDKLNIPAVYYDLYPEHPRIKQQDFLKLELEYKSGRVVIGNPPFSSTVASLYKSFLKKSASIGEYIVFILPVSQYNNDFNFPYGTLIHSELLNEVEFIGRKNVKVKTCFNIYKIGSKERSNKYEVVNKDVEFIKVNRTNKHKKYFHNNLYWEKDPKELKCDCFLSTFGEPILFTEDVNELYKCGYVGVRIINKNRKDEILEFFRTFAGKYLKEINDMSTSAPSITFWYIKDKMIKELYS